jgi:hypothetical protein
VGQGKRICREVGGGRGNREHSGQKLLRGVLRITERIFSSKTEPENLRTGGHGCPLPMQFKWLRRAKGKSLTTGMGHRNPGRQERSRWDQNDGVKNILVKMLDPNR